MSEPSSRAERHGAPRAQLRARFLWGLWIGLLAGAFLGILAAGIWTGLWT